MQKRPLIWVGMILGILMIVAAACTPAQLLELGMVPMGWFNDNRLLGGEVAALPTPAAADATATPAASTVIIPTPAPTVIGPLATLTAIAGLVPTVEINSEPYVVDRQGRPHFIEFQAPW